ncbi:MAG TPA: peptidase MA family metallohydrolase [Chitinispirillaceae bacterium]|nr:peptidase MA family metallohydrolase [Chitinispirillaceae bacterium]
MKILCWLILSIFSISAVGEDYASLNKLGVDAFKSGDLKAATEHFYNALKYSPDNSQIKNNYAAACRSLAADYSKRNDWTGIIEILSKANSFVPENTDVRNDLVFAYVNFGASALYVKNLAGAQHAASEALLLDPQNTSVNCLAGDVAYEQHDYDAAEKYWKQAKASSPNNKAIDKRISKLKGEKRVERSYSQMKAYHFDIRFDYKALGQGVYDLREFLMEAYEKVGQDFNQFPEYPIIVVLSNENDFRMVNNVPDFVAGLYDGKIRIPVNFAKVPLSTLKSIVFHEYTHALIYEIAGTSCPIWLNEGIAMRQMRNDNLVSTDVLRNAIQSGTLLSYQQINDRSSIWNSEAYVSLAYAQAWIMAEYLFTRWNYLQVKNVLVRLKQGESFETIIQSSMNRTLAQFDEEWKLFARNRL